MFQLLNNWQPIWRDASSHLRASNTSCKGSPDLLCMVGLLEEKKKSTCLPIICLRLCFNTRSSISSRIPDCRGRGEASLVSIPSLCLSLLLSLTNRNGLTTFLHLSQSPAAKHQSRYSNVFWDNNDVARVAATCCLIHSRVSLRGRERRKQQEKKHSPPHPTSTAD